MLLSLDESSVVWPGGLTQKPTGLMIPTHLKVLTVMEQPFVYARKLGQAGPGSNYNANTERKTIGGNLGSFLDGLDEDVSHEAISEDNKDAELKASRTLPLPEGYCDRERGEIECPLYRKDADGGKKKLHFCYPFSAASTAGGSAAITSLCAI